MILGERILYFELVITGILGGLWHVITWVVATFSDPVRTE